MNTIDHITNASHVSSIESRLNPLLISGLRQKVRIRLADRSIGMKISAFFTVVCFSLSALAQQPVGSWRSHLPMTKFQWIGETETHVYAANTYGVLAYDKSESSAEALTKVNSLSQTGISCFECSSNHGICVVGYSNGNLDIIQGNTVTNQPAISTSQVIGDKQIHAVLFQDDFAWLATGIGLLQLDINSFNILERVKVIYQNEQQQILRVAQHQDSVFVTTPTRLFKLPLSTILTDPEPFPVDIDRSTEAISQLHVHNGDLYAVYRTELYQEDTLYRYEGSGFAEMSSLTGGAIRHLDSQGELLLVTHADHVAEYSSTFVQIRTIFTYGNDVGMDCEQARYALETDRVVIADAKYGGIRSSLADQYNPDVFSINSPISGQISNVIYNDNALFALPGGNEFTFLPPNIHRLQEQTWSNGYMRTASFPTFSNGSDIAVFDSYYMVSSDRGGLARLNKNLELVTVFNENNSPIDDLYEDSGYDYYGITGIEKTESNHLFVAHNKNSTPLKILHPDDTWTEISFTEDALKSPKTADLLMLDNGYLLLNIIDVGILVYDANGTPRNTADDRYALLTSSPSEGNLPSSQVTCFTQDNDGEIWVGTDAGIGVIYSPENIFNNAFEGAQRIIVNQDGYNGYLFETETVEAIEVDGANRKWVGTFGSGLFLISADGIDQIHHFTTEESPLLNDKVLDLEIDPTTGELFIASENGLLSYRSDATASQANLSDIKIFPNPVKPGFSGQIAISNVTENAYVRITDAAGALVFETQSLGGQAVWNGRDFSGQRVSSGVYLVHVASQDGAEGKVSKILFLN